MGDAGRRRRSQLELVDEDKSPLLGKKGSPDLGSFIGHESSSFFPRSSVAGTAREFMAWRAFALSLSLSLLLPTTTIFFFFFLFSFDALIRDTRVRATSRLSLSFPKRTFLSSPSAFSGLAKEDNKKRKRDQSTLLHRPGRSCCVFVC